MEPIAYVKEVLEKAGWAFRVEVPVPSDWPRDVIESTKAAYREAGWLLYEVKGPRDKHIFEMFQGLR